MGNVRLSTGLFRKVDGIAIETLETVPTGAVENIPARTGTNGCRLQIGNFSPRI